MRLLERVHFHETALTAKAVIRRAGNKCFRGNLFAQPMQQAGFGHDDDLMRRRLSAKSHHLFRRTNFISQHAHGIGAFRMRNDRCIGIFFADATDAARGELDVHVTSPLPQIHFAPGPFHHPGTKVLVWNEENISISRRRAHDLVGIAARTNHIRERFHAGAAVDVSDDVIVLAGVLFQKLR